MKSVYACAPPAVGKVLAVLPVAAGVSSCVRSLPLVRPTTRRSGIAPRLARNATLATAAVNCGSSLASRITSTGYRWAEPLEFAGGAAQIVWSSPSLVDLKVSFSHSDELEDWAWAAVAVTQARRIVRKAGMRVRSTRVV